MTVSIYCPHCQKHTDLRVARYITRNGYVGEKSTDAITNELGDDRWWIGICNSCNSPVLVRGSGDIIYPHPLPSPSEKEIPSDLRIDLDEAKKCFAVSCYRACAVIARRCIQKACIMKGAKKSNLVDQVRELATSGKITKDIEEWATVVRYIGNDGAHPNAAEVTREDAEDCLALAEQFLHVLFVAPAIAKARREKRGASI